MAQRLCPQAHGALVVCGNQKTNCKTDALMGSDLSAESIACSG